MADQGGPGVGRVEPQGGAGRAQGDQTSLMDSIRETRVVRSSRRRKTVSARVEDGVLIVQVPSRISEKEAQGWVDRMKRRMASRLERDALNSHEDLQRRALRLSQRYFDAPLHFESIEYVTNQRSKYGSCSPGSRRIRISHRLASMPSFVLEYIIVHELAHLVEPNHGERFWELVRRYPLTERAIGFLMGAGLAPKRDRAHAEPSDWLPAEEVGGGEGDGFGLVGTGGG